MANKINTFVKISVTVWLFFCVCAIFSTSAVFAQTLNGEPMPGQLNNRDTQFNPSPQQQQYVPLAPIDTDPGIYQVNNFGAFLNGMMKILISLGAVLAVLLIVIGGFQYITSASEGGKGSAKERIENALIGLAILLGSYLILNTINPDLVNTQLMVQQIAPSGLGAPSGGSPSTIPVAPNQFTPLDQGQTRVFERVVSNNDGSLTGQQVDTAVRTAVQECFQNNGGYSGSTRLNGSVALRSPDGRLLFRSTAPTGGGDFRLICSRVQ